ncbi:MAG: FeoB-associated Cys-rich membrane protein [Firmicutes bacterium]|nr:FeoB-associated Cys-rich membrane protein [Bacillota bacterium]
MKAWLIMSGVIIFIIGITVWSVLRAIRNESGCGPCAGCCGGCPFKKPDSSACEGMDLFC